MDSLKKTIAAKTAVIWEFGDVIICNQVITPSAFCNITRDHEFPNHFLVIL